MRRASCRPSKAINEPASRSIAYDASSKIQNALYITFDNVGVGRIRRRRCSRCKPEGNYAFIKGDKGDPNADFLFSGQMEVLKAAHGLRQDQECLRDLHRRLEAGQCPEEHGAVPDLDRQQGRCGRADERRHGRRRRRGARRAGPRRLRAGDRPGRRQGRPQPRRARHADRLGLEGLARPRQARRPRSRSRSPTAPTRPRSKGVAKFNGGTRASR